MTFFKLEEKVALTVNNPARTKGIYFNITAEKLLLRSMLREDKFFLLVNDQLDKYSFYNELHQSVFLAMRSVFKKGNIVNAVSVCNELGTTFESDSEGAKGVRLLLDFKLGNSDKGYLSDQEFLEVLRHVASQHRGRESIRTVNKALFLLIEQKELNWQEVIANLSNELYNINEKFSAGESPKEDTKDSVKKAIFTIENGEQVSFGLLTGIKHLDWKLKGFKPGEMITFIASPGSGKSALMLSALYNMVFDEGKSCVYVSYKMSQNQVSLRLAKMNVFNSPKPVDYDDLKANFTALVDLDKYRFLDAEGMNVQALRSKLLLMHRNSPLDCIFVDYINNIPSISPTYYKNARISEVSGGLRQIAKELQLPLVTAAQLNKVAARDTRPPVAADIRDATEIADHSHKIVSIFRPSIHGITEYERGGQRFSEEETLDLAILNICKNRDGDMGRVYAHFNAKATYFSNWADTDANFDPEYEEYLDALKDSVEPSSNGTYTLPYDDVPF